MLLECQDSCIINGVNTTKKIKPQKVARQGDSMSAYLFILCLEIVFILIKADKRVKEINVFEDTYLFVFSLRRRYYFFLKRQKIY